MNVSKFYTYRVTWSEEDGEHVALCAEFPSLSYLDECASVALQGIIDLVTGIIECMKDQNEPIPEPIAKKNYSGKFQVRITPEKHRILAIKAAEQGVSMNRYVSSLLS